jgi:hypothetical protein
MSMSPFAEIREAYEDGLSGPRQGDKAWMPPATPVFEHAVIQYVPGPFVEGTEWPQPIGTRFTAREVVTLIVKDQFLLQYDPRHHEWGFGPLTELGLTRTNHSFPSFFEREGVVCCKFHLFLYSPPHSTTLGVFITAHEQSSGIATSISQHPSVLARTESNRPRVDTPQALVSNGERVSLSVCFQSLFQ